MFLPPFFGSLETWMEVKMVSNWFRNNSKKALEPEGVFEGLTILSFRVLF